MLALVLFALSSVTHFILFGWPQQVVFDEVYFTTFVGYYSKAAYYFDVHPPLAKILAMYFGNMVGAVYDTDMTSIGNTLPWGVVLLRILPMIAGILLPVVIYYICRHLNFSKWGSFAVGLLIVLENSLLVQTKFLLFDGIMILFGLISVLLYLIYVRRGKGVWLLVLSALFAASAFSIKWTGFAFPLLITTAEIVRTKNTFKILKFAALYAVIGLFFYLSVFAVHFAYLTNSGPGDPFMTDRFQKTLVGNHYHDFPDPEIRPRGFFGKTIELNLEMLEANKSLTAEHTYSSKWYTWPLMIRSIFYWQGQGDEANGNEYIYLLGNPLIYWVGTVAMLFLLWQVIFKKHRSKVALFIVTGYLVNFLPFIFIGRVMFIYHYLAALIFSIIAIGYIWETFIPKQKQKRYAYGFLGLALVVFLFFAPLTYGTHLSERGLKARMWLATWR
jgi:dolichyl-phosphate-mannose-protein mannosyltransferase